MKLSNSVTIDGLLIATAGLAYSLGLSYAAVKIVQQEPHTLATMTCSIVFAIAAAAFMWITGKAFKAAMHMRKEFQRFEKEAEEDHASSS